MTEKEALFARNEFCNRENHSVFVNVGVWGRGGGGVKNENDLDSCRAHLLTGTNFFSLVELLTWDKLFACRFIPVL